MRTSAPFHFIILFFTSCASVYNPWQLVQIDSNQPLSRLRYCPQEPFHPIRFELTARDGEIQGFLTLSQFSLSNPVVMKWIIDGEEYEHPLMIHEGGMRATLSKEVVTQMLDALKKGKQVDILLEEFSLSLDPKQFEPIF